MMTCEWFWQRCVNVICRLMFVVALIMLLYVQLSLFSSIFKHKLFEEVDGRVYNFVENGGSEFLVAAMGIEYSGDFDFRRMQ